MVSISRLPVLAAPKGSAPKEALVPQAIMKMCPMMLILQLLLRKIIRIVIPISRLPIFDAPKGSRHNAGTFAENDDVNVSSYVDPTINVEKNTNNSDDQKDDNIFCLENKIINEDKSYNVDFV